MAETNNFTEITENFDTIKALLNSIRAQGILNTSDVDKLLTGINSKLEKINTEEDIDLIKIFLSELKQNLDERHNVLLSKFGAIESLFSNLLKNSSEMLKSSEVKELFDIVATNLSVFSREVVSQKETLTDITLRLDAMRSDDSQKKEIIKNVSILKNDIERLTNGFDSIVLSLNENFKTIIKTIANIDPSENINKFGEEIKDIVNSSNTILSALQMLDKKNLQIEDVLRGLATSEDLASAKKSIGDLAIQEQALTQSISALSEKYYKIDNLADKIDASVDIIVGLKTFISEKDAQSAAAVIDKLVDLQNSVINITTNEQFEEFKQELEKTLNDILSQSNNLNSIFVQTSDEIKRISEAVFALDINANFKTLSSEITKSEQALREHVSVEAGKTSQLVDVNSTRIINEISNGATHLADSFNKAQSALSQLCEKSFGDVEENIINLKSVVKQIDENNVSANNAIFSNITDRLALFENDLKSSLERQEDSVAVSSSKLLEQIAGIKDLSGVLDYKIDSSVIEINNAKNEFTGLKTAVEDVLALDFTSKVKDLKVDLYAIKQDLSNALETTTGDLDEKFTNDLFGKYELLVSKLDSVETELKQAQNSALVNLKNSLDNISSSIVDVLSYVSSDRELNTESLDSKLEEISKVVNDTSLNYIENVRDVVDVIRTQVENNLKSIQDDTSKQVGILNSTVIKGNEELKSDIKNSYDKLLEVQENFDEIKNVISESNSSLSNNFATVIETAGNLRDDFETKLSALKNAVLEKVADFQQEFTCDNADKISEIKFAAENLHTKNVQNSLDIKNELKGEIVRLVGGIKLNVEELAEQLAGTMLKVEGANHEIIDFIRNDFGIKVDKTIDALELQVSDLSGELTNKVEDIVGKFENLQTSVNSLSTNTTNSLTSTLAKILDNFIALKGVLATYDEKYAENLKLNVDVITNDFAKLRDRLNDVDANIDEDLTRQLSLIESNFEQFGNNIAQFFEDTNKQLDSSIKSGLDDISDSVRNSVSQNLEQYKGKIEELFSDITVKNDEQLKLISAKVLELNKTLNDCMDAQNAASADNLNKIANNLKNIIDNNIELTSADYTALRESLTGFANNIEIQNQKTAEILKAQLDDIAKYVDSGIEVQAQDVNTKFDEISGKISATSDKINEIRSDISTKILDVADLITNTKSANLSNTNEKTTLILSKLDEVAGNLAEKNNLVLNSFADKTEVLNNLINENISGVKSDLSEGFASVIDENQTVKNVIKEVIEQNYHDLSEKLNNLAAKNGENTDDLKSVISYNGENIISKLKSIADCTVDITEEIKDAVKENGEKIAADFVSLRQDSADSSDKILTLIEGNSNELTNSLADLINAHNVVSQELKSLISQNNTIISGKIEEAFVNNATENAAQTEVLKNVISESASDLNTKITNELNELSDLANNLADDQNQNIKDYVQIILDELKAINKDIDDKSLLVKTTFEENISSEIKELFDKILSLFEENSLSILTQLTNGNSKLADDLNARAMEFKANFETLNERLDKDEISRMNVFQAQLKELSGTFNVLIDEAKAVTKAEVSSISQTLIQNSREAMEEVEQSIEDKVNAVLASSADIAAGELKSMEMFTNKILAQVEVNKKTIVDCRDFVNNFVKNELEIIADSIEKEADVIVKDLLEQTSLMKDFQRDELVKMANQIENMVEDHIFNHINDLKSYLDIKIDNSALNNKLDNITSNLNKTAEDILAASSKLLQASVFDNSIADLRASNKVLIDTMAENLDTQLKLFIRDNVSNKFDEQFKLFDKKFIDTVVDKYEEIKLISSKYNNSFEAIQGSVANMVSEFVKSKDEINKSILTSLNGITGFIDELNQSFEDLKAQISNKSFDEAFQASINKQVGGIEELVKEQMGYLEDISELCCANLPELTEMNTLVKYSVMQSVSNLSEKLENSENNIGKELVELKTDIITQFLNIFNQISFVAEQEEILDFIQEKHAELITILSHIVTTVDDVENIKDNLSVVDNKVDTLKEDIDLINEKITSIISSSGDINYVYSLQDLESDIANLRLILNEIKDSNKSKELEELVNSTNDVYKLVESLKNEFPSFDSEEFKKDFEALSEDIVSISTRTNKLILASDESYKTLQENLQDFKLVINDLDERTRNFSQEVGIERIDNKLGAINSMIQNGAKTNQVFNQVFEYLAEWVDNAGAQITSISDKVETLDDIGQIKVMLEDLKAEAEDNSESNELIEALSNVFDKQAKKIASLEAKLDRMIVESTISNKNNKIDMSPMEDTLNRFLVAIDSRMAEQQNKIQSLEQKLEDVMSKVDTKDTAQLTKKVGGMDRQIAKLNKSIEKIASHVVEK